MCKKFCCGFDDGGLQRSTASPGNNGDLNPTTTRDGILPTRIMLEADPSQGLHMRTQPSRHLDFSLVIPNRKPSHDAMQIADLWNYELTNRCFFKPLSLWQFVMQQQKTNTACLSEVFSSPKHTCDIFSAAVVPHTHPYRTSHQVL